MTAEIVPLKACDLDHQQQETGDYDSVLKAVYSTVNDQLSQLFEGMVKSATGKLVLMDGQIQGFDNQKTYIEEAFEREAIRYLLNDTENIRSRFFMNIDELLKPGDDNPESPIEEELSLVSHEEMEEMVAITTMNANAINDFGEAISDLSERVKYLGIKNAPIFSSKAISPKSLCETYQKTLNQLNVGTDVNLALFKLFDKEVNQKLENLYDNLNQLFIDADIMPEIVHTSHDDEESYDEETYDELEEESTFSAESFGYDDKGEYPNIDFIPRSQAELNDIVTQFTRGNINVPVDTLNLPSSKLPESFYKDPAQHKLDSSHYYQRKDVVRSLDRLQQRLMEKGEDTGLNNAEQIKSSLMEEIGGTNSDGTTKEVAVLDERNIDFVGLLFNAISDDKSISEVVNKLVSQLHIPVLKVALDDEQLFQDKAHPTRKVLNLIPRAGKGVTDTKDNLYNKIEDVVKEILAERDVDVESFYKAVDTLHNIIHYEEKTAATIEKEEKRNVIKEHARTVVVAELRKYSIGKFVPKNVQPLILKHWSTLMLNRYIKHGNESELWSQASLLCKLIIETLQPVKNKSQWELLNNNYYALVEVVHDELYETQQDKHSIDNQIETLNDIFNKMLDKFGQMNFDDEKTASAPIDHVAQKEIEAYEAAMARINAEEESVVEKVARLPTYVKAGAWFEIYNGEDRPVRRLKMSVILLETAKIVFVDHKGVNIIEKDAGVFGEELEADKSRIIADHSTFDNALGKVISMMAA